MAIFYTSLQYDYFSMISIPFSLAKLFNSGVAGRRLMPCQATLFYFWMLFHYCTVVFAKTKSVSISIYLRYKLARTLLRQLTLERCTWRLVTSLQHDRQRDEEPMSVDTLVGRCRHVFDCTTVVPAMAGPLGERPPALAGHFCNVPTTLPC